LDGRQTLATARRVLTSRRGAAGCVAGPVSANRIATLRLPRRAGRQTVAIRLAAETNPARAQTVVRSIFTGPS
jgi:hypothetical protein